tara:strand:- start:2669 stop:3655 length:987 start_codon:yes stop_codon:yes gene_type:complete
MELLKLTKKDIFKKSSMNSTQNIDFYEPFSDYEIYNENAYKNIRPIFKNFISDYKVEQTKDDFNKKILDIQKQEEKEITENLGEISIQKDPRITKYEDTYSITPYATYLLTPLSDIDGEDIVSRFDRCYGEWVNKHHEKCHKNQPCKRIKQHFRIHNPDYTGDHCRDKEGRRLRDDDTRHVFCNHYQNHSEKCSGEGKCTRNTIGTNGSNTCICNGSYTGPNCENVITCESNNDCLNGGTCVNGKCNCSSGWYGVNCNNGDKYRCNTNSDCNDGNTCEQTGLNLKCCTKDKQTAYICNPNASPSEYCHSEIKCDNTLCKNNICCCPPL